jgi:hypothetical protein
MSKNLNGSVAKAGADKIRRKGKSKMDLVKVIREIQRKKAERERWKNQAFCFLCNQQVSLLSFQQAVELGEESRQRIIELAENNLIHRIHNSRGEVLIVKILSLKPGLIRKKLCRCVPNS